MIFRGIQKTSLIDYPGKISAVVFTGGCNLRCKFCHNSELALNLPDLPEYTEDDILKFLGTRKGLLDALVISGGEPALIKGIDEFCIKVKQLGLQVKFDTNGYYPEIVLNLINKNCVDYFAIDIKTSPEKYQSLTQTSHDFEKVFQTIEIIKQSGIDYELRTTCVPGYADIADFEVIKSKLGNVKNYYLQQFTNEKTLSDELRELDPHTYEHIHELREFCSSFAEKAMVRGL